MGQPLHTDSLTKEVEARASIRRRLVRISQEIAKIENKYHQYLFETDEHQLECLRAVIDRLTDKY